MTIFPTLPPGGTIGIMAPSNRTDRAQAEAAVRQLEAAGYKIKVHPQTHLQFHQSAGTPAEKAAAFHELWADPDVDAIMAARGGNQASKMLPLLDFKLLAQTPKVLIGFSDVTALLTAIYKNTGIVTFHGPLLHSLKDLAPGQLAQALGLLSGKDKIIDLAPARILRSGTTSGRLVGGNLSLISSLMGTPYEPDFDNGILFLEDIGDEISRMDRMLQQINLAGVFKKLKGLIIGDFSKLGDSGVIPFGLTLQQVIEQHIQNTDYPVVMDAPFGHNNRLITLPVGAVAELKAAGTATLTLS